MNDRKTREYWSPWMYVYTVHLLYSVSPSLVSFSFTHFFRCVFVYNVILRFFPPALLRLQLQILLIRNNIIFLYLSLSNYLTPLWWWLSVGFRVMRVKPLLVIRYIAWRLGHTMLKSFFIVFYFYLFFFFVIRIAGHLFWFHWYQHHSTRFEGDRTDRWRCTFIFAMVEYYWYTWTRQYAVGYFYLSDPGSILSVNLVRLDLILVKAFQLNYWEGRGG